MRQNELDQYILYITDNQNCQKIKGFLMNVTEIFDRMYNRYGPQKWWPSTLPGENKPTYNNKRLNKITRYEIAVGAILTQNTNWKNVEKSIINLNKHNLMSPEKIITTAPNKLRISIKS